MTDEEARDRRGMFALVLLHAIVMRDGANASAPALAVALADDLARELDHPHSEPEAKAS